MGNALSEGFFHFKQRPVRTLSVFSPTLVHPFHTLAAKLRFLPCSAPPVAGRQLGRGHMVAANRPSVGHRHARYTTSVPYPHGSAVTSFAIPHLVFFVPAVTIEPEPTRTWMPPPAAPERRAIGAHSGHQWTPAVSGHQGRVIASIVLGPSNPSGFRVIERLLDRLLPFTALITRAKAALRGSCDLISPLNIFRETPVSRCLIHTTPSCDRARSPRRDSPAKVNWTPLLEGGVSPGIGWSSRSTLR